jgi:molybdate-binding protein/predicted nucleic acid-binding protein
MSSPIRILLDTSCCLTIIRRRWHGITSLLESYRPGEVAISALTVAVLEAAARRSGNPECNRQALAQFLLPLVVVDFDAESAGVLGRMKGGIGFGRIQVAHTVLLAAQALRHNAALVTAQAALYADIDGLIVHTVGDAGELSAPVQTALSARSENGRAIRISGSHDLSLTLLGDWLHAEHPDLHFAVTNVGSLLGLVALLQQEAHLAGSHLFDEETGDFNIGPVRKMLSAQGLHVVVLGFVERVQGILVARSNPKRIGGVEDLCRDDVVFVNRQSGAGTRILLDYQLRRLGIDSAQINGYTREEMTHLAVATAVAQGAADCGMGIQAAAHALDLDFIPVIEERFDLVIPVEFFESALLAPLIALLRRRDSAFRERVTALGGYNTQPMGRVMAET